MIYPQLWCLISEYGFKPSQELLDTWEYARGGRMAAILIINTTMPMKILPPPLAELLVTGKLQSPVTANDFDPHYHSREKELAS